MSICVPGLSTGSKCPLETGQVAINKFEARVQDARLSWHEFFIPKNCPEDFYFRKWWRRTGWLWGLPRIRIIIWKIAKTFLFSSSVSFSINIEKLNSNKFISFKFNWDSFTILYFYIKQNNVEKFEFSKNVILLHCTLIFPVYFLVNPL